MSAPLDLEALDRDASKHTLWRTAMMVGPLMAGVLAVVPVVVLTVLLLQGLHANRSYLLAALGALPCVIVGSVMLPVIVLLVVGTRSTRRENNAIRAVVDAPAVNSNIAVSWRQWRRRLRVWRAVVGLLGVLMLSVIFIDVILLFAATGLFIIASWSGRAILERIRHNILNHSRNGHHAKALEAHGKPWVFFIAGFETAQVYFNADQPEEAFEILRIATHNARATPHLLRQWTRQQLLLDRAEDTLQQSTIALKLDPGNGQGNRLRAEVDLHLGEVCSTTHPLLDRALAYEDRALAKTPNEMALILADFAWLAALQKDAIEARQRLQAAREHFDESKPVSAADVHLRLARTAHLLGDLEGQQQALGRAATLDATGIRGRIAREGLNTPAE